MWLLLQPPAEILPTPPGMVIHAALGDFDVLVGFLHHHDYMAVAAVDVADQITGANLLPAWAVDPPPRKVTESGIAA